MASLYDGSISNDELLAQKNLRHRRINFDYEYISKFPVNNYSLFRSISWTTVDFNKIEVSKITTGQGLYVFNFSPTSFSLLNWDANVPLYIGQASSLRNRLMSYFNYVNSNKASDQDKRFMILFFSGFLKISYYETKSLNTSDLDELEYTLIDSIIPPFNLRFRSQLAQSYRRILN